jgi:hypothetical protein
MTCRHCDAVVRTPSQAGWLAASIPGAGHLYCGRPVAAIARLLSELAVFAVLAFLVLATTDVWRVLAVVAGGFGLLAVMKLHGIWSARLLAERAGVIGPGAAGRWRWAVPLGLGLSTAVLLAPLPLAGHIEQEITWDLMLIDSHGEWRRLDPQSDPDGESADNLRSVWAHSGGQQITVRARPVPPFQSISQTKQSILTETEAPQTSHTVGAFTTFKLIATPHQTGSRVTTRVLDPVGRDVHDVETTAASGRELEARKLLTHFLERSIWVRPSRPPG